MPKGVHSKNKFSPYIPRAGKSSWYFTGENNSYVEQGWNREYRLVDEYFETDAQAVINDLTPKHTKEE